MKRKIALITGASSGLGREFARIHAANDGDLVIVARNAATLYELKAELEKMYSVQVIVISKDLSQPNAAQEIYDNLKQQNISIDYLINNAGLGGQGRFDKRGMELDMNLIAVDVIALTQLMKLFLPDFIARGSGRILNVSSTAALLPGPYQAVYYAAKAYVTSLGNAVWAELKGTGVTVTTLMPGGMDTGFAKASNLEGTGLSKQMTFPPSVVAKDGYESMLRGDLNTISKFTPLQNFLFKLIPFLPRTFVMKQIMNMQKR